MHPLARATLVKKVVSGSVPEFMSLVVEWLQSRYKPLSLGAMLCDLEPTAVQWKMLSELGGPPGTAIFKVVTTVDPGLACDSPLIALGLADDCPLSAL